MTAATIAGHSNKSEYSKKNGYRKSSKTPWGNPIVYFFSLVLVAICITPVLYIIFGGFRTNSQITNHPSGMPNPWVPDNYKTVFESDIFWTELKNSTIVGIATMVGVVVLSIMVSFVIARYKFRYAPLMYALFSAGLMFPMTVGHYTFVSADSQSGSGQLPVGSDPSANCLRTSSDHHHLGAVPTVDS